MTYEILIKHLGTEGFTVEKGLAKAVLPDDRGKDYYQWLGEEGSRDFDTALEERITLPYENGLLVVRETDGSIKYDDRKMRYSHTDSANGSNVIYVGPTHFKEFRNANLKAIADEEFNKSLRSRGEREFQDPWAYFANPFATNAVPVTDDGYVHIVKRNEIVETMPGYWHVVGGMMDTNLSLFEDPNPTETLKDLIKKGIAKEFKEEGDLESVTFSLTGLARSINAVEFTHIAYVESTSQEFIDSFEAAKGKEHADIRAFSTNEALRDFLTSLPESGEKMVPTGHASLLCYLEAERKV